MAQGTHEKPNRPVAVKNVATRLVKTEPTKTCKLFRKFMELARRELWTKEDPGHSVDWKDDRVWGKIQKEGRFYQADEMLVSCGTVTVDQADSTRPMVLVVYNKNIGIYQLPKGRKNFDEGNLEAALRETSEETGVAVQPLRLRFGSRSTPPRLAPVETTTRVTKYGLEDKLTGITEALCSEAVGGNPDPATGAWRHIYWYAAKPLGDTKRDESRMTEEEDRNKFSTFWFPETEAIARLKLQDEQYMVRLVFATIRKMTASDWASSHEQEGWQKK
ncbi:hypothetical protein F5Y00DRAFT_260324 [Daldinia vernicosa]|uniref:uncharacterized protein n=1 Tax=Daldinia vernicosa TaxID=114800 RepID=UPI0020084F7F|nr:uncharacterized protein F5Y00DRAFT_260324 [Daldinia vernicosa]KAI0850874.1 hypothetical protein F5Y00DRAFT_260324 [Daldinia vernicosa]